MKKGIAILFALTMAMAFTKNSNAEDYEEELTSTVYENGVGKFVYTVRTGLRLHDKFTYQRTVLVDEYGDPLPRTQLQGAFVLLPGGASSTALYDLEPGDRSLIEYLAENGWDVYSYNPRTAGMSTLTCTLQKSIIGEWGMQRYVDDINIIRILASLRHGLERPAIGGLSLGAMLTIASLNEHPLLWKAAIIWDGTLYYDDEDLQEIYQEPCDDYADAVEAGDTIDTLSYTGLKSFWQAYRTNPTGWSLWSIAFCGFGYTNEECIYEFATNPQDPPLAEAPDYVYLAGNTDPGEFYFADEDLMDAAVAQFNNCEPIALMRDYYCGFAGSREFTDNLDGYYGPILTMRTGMGFGPHMSDNMAFFTNADYIDDHYEADFGHADYMVNEDYIDETADVILDWLDANAT